MATRPKTGGRKRGVKNKRTVALERAQAENAQKIAGALGPGAFDGNAHAFLTSVYKDPSQPMELRVMAAGKAINFEMPRLNSIDASISGKVGLEQLIRQSMGEGAANNSAR